MSTKPARQSSTRSNDLLRHAAELQRRYEAQTSPDDRKLRGQFFTPPAVARYMAGLLVLPHRRIRVLDPGAGIGSLSAAIVDRALPLRSKRTLHFVLYETDQAVLPFLNQNLSYCRSIAQRAGHCMTYEIRADDFILDNERAFEQPMLFQAEEQSAPFDIAIMNPPYFKIQKSSAYAVLMSRIVHGQPNIYALFMAVAAEMLPSRGQLVAITPRSFCGGLYFRDFRRWFLQRMSLRHIHLFQSRRATFRDANVLQESIITQWNRSAITTPGIGISTSVDADFHAEATSFELPTERVVDDTCGNMVIRIPETPKDARLMDLVEAWPHRFTDLGLRVSTGPVVMFRATEFLIERWNCPDHAPLLSVHNVKPFETVWPLRKNGKPMAFKVCAKSLSRRLLLPATTLVLLRRFSAKEERRRLTASCYFRMSKYGTFVALENHLNYIYHEERELTRTEAYGLAALFNSAILDRYFRTLSGNTQVNATEIRTMNFPSLMEIDCIGERLTALGDFSIDQAEQVVFDVLELDRVLRAYVTESA